MKEFTVTDEHLKLLRRAYVTWNGCEFGAPGIDCKRPYGNSSVYQDMGEILGIDPEGMYDEFTPEQEDHMGRLHEETQTVLRVILTTGRMEPGTYRRSSSYSSDWRRV